MTGDFYAPQFQTRQGPNPIDITDPYLNWESFQRLTPEQLFPRNAADVVYGYPGFGRDAQAWFDFFGIAYTPVTYAGTEGGDPVHMLELAEPFESAWQKVRARVGTDKLILMMRFAPEDYFDGKKPRDISQRDLSNNIYNTQGDLIYTSFLRVDGYSGWLGKLGELTPILYAVGIAYITAGVATGVGEAIVGPAITASYPGVAQVVGQAAIQTVASRGDIEAALTAALASVLAVQVGGTLQIVADSQALGNVATAVTRAAILGGDVQQAALNSVLSQGARGVADLVRIVPAPTAISSAGVDYSLTATTTPGASMDFFSTPDFGLPDTSGVDFGLQDGGSWDFGFSDNVTTSYNPTDYVFGGMDLGTGSSGATALDLFPGSNPNYGFGDADFGDVTFGASGGSAQYTFGSLPTYSGGSALDSPDPGFVITDNPINVPATPGGGGGGFFDAIGDFFSGFDAGEVLTGLTTFAVAALPLVRAWNGAQPLPTVQQTVQGTVRANANGTITTSSAAGVRTTLPPAGQAYTTADGGTVVNNGNGTYTRILATGQQQTLPYTAQSTATPGYAGAVSPLSASFGGVSPVVLLGGGGLLLALLLSRGRR